jgi:hypothetical protein
MTFLKPIAAAVIAVASLVGVASATASTATPTPAGAYTATSGILQFTLNTARKSLNCTSSSYTATDAVASGTLPLTLASNVQFTFSGPCTVTGGAGITFRCPNPASLNATGVTVNGVSSMSLTGISCTVNVTASACAVTLGGTVIGYYDNRARALTIFNFAQTMTTSGSTNGSGGACTLLPNDSSVTFTGNPSSLVYTPSPARSITVV